MHWLYPSVCSIGKFMVPCHRIISNIEKYKIKMLFGNSFLKLQNEIILKTLLEKFYPLILSGWNSNSSACFSRHSRAGLLLVSLSCISSLHALPFLLGPQNQNICPSLLLHVTPVLHVLFSLPGTSFISSGEKPASSVSLILTSTSYPMSLLAPQTFNHCWRPPFRDLPLLTPWTHLASSYTY